jgi:nitroreductase
LKAGQLAPTACNYQPQRILVIDNEATREKLDTCTPCRFNAPAAMHNQRVSLEHTVFYNSFS